MKRACPNCKGIGLVYTDLAMMAGVASVCEKCEGKRFTAEVLTYRLRGKNISEVLGMSVTEAQRIAMKRGNNLGFRSALVACPASGQGAVVMTNGNGGEVIVDAVLDALAGRFSWPARAPWPE